ncbi:hypothetical protein FHR83_004146 [Actinoplanes campanulatus]|uniref:Acyl-CoA dehydrogenase n=1 Tax=Actinoplanes campanulatus TaxID=113559 RepID=A0A7W5FFH3_9ACTN|nr:acyl-CoA dehydrogenase family protein [Actinoplanes campanulatus]MBB3096476.1 hypothetical protein [Actinoplanes campanulatus]GGN18022.1 acyl-CoA dehydrogenase [Actinoplanes campanulatus]GID38543.1 acyl-CoA dehydrogenase [Actinoplanes campanulatus]
MDFQPDGSHQAISRLAGEVLDGSAGDPDKAWAALGQTGLLTLAVPERLGGAGLGVLETTLVLTEIGRRALDLPALGHLVAILTGAHEPGRTFGIAVAEPGDPLPAAPRTTFADGTVTGVKTGVTAADRLLVTVAGPAVVTIDPAGPGATLDRGILRLDRAAAHPLGDDKTHQDLHRYAVSCACALGDGALAGALALTAEHVRTRRQFGRPLATFQAVAQQIADVYIASHTLHLATLAASWRLGTGRDADDDLHVAAQWLTAEAPPAARTCHHLHGGLGLAIDYPLHRHTTLIRDLVRFLGGAEHRLTTLGERLVHRPD